MDRFFRFTDWLATRKTLLILRGQDRESYIKSLHVFLSQGQIQQVVQLAEIGAQLDKVQSEYCNPTNDDEEVLEMTVLHDFFEEKLQVLFFFIAKSC